MTTHVSHADAKEVLARAIQRAKDPDFAPSSRHSSQVETIIKGSHLTFRYVLMTGLTAAATNPAANPLALQAGSALPGAYDARSLCHQVIVPLERQLLGNSLGGSNEPFLNKPARLPEIATTNPVRRGKDQAALHAVHRVLEDISKQKSATDAYAALCDAVYYALQRRQFSATDLKVETLSRSGLAEITQFFDRFLGKTLKGETAALTAGAIFKLWTRTAAQDMTVTVHPVHQSGKSSNEISDIDVTLGDVLIYTAEVKDKEFNREDSLHAVRKVKAVGHPRLLFLVGQQGRLHGVTEQEVVKAAAEQGVDLVFVDVLDFAKVQLAMSTTVNTAQIIEDLLGFAAAARVSDETLAHLRECASAFGWM